MELLGKGEGICFITIEITAELDKHIRNGTIKCTYVLSMSTKYLQETNSISRLIIQVGY
jgi:hypothetical protein